MVKLALIGLFGAVGAIGRYVVSSNMAKWLGDDLPWGTLAVNVAGCFLLGALYTFAHTNEWLTDEWRQGLGIGLLGGLTTFSTFGYETFRLAENGMWTSAAGNIAANVLLGLVGVWLGVTVVRLAA